MEEDSSYNPLSDVTNQHLQLAESTAETSSILLSSSATDKKKKSSVWGEDNDLTGGEPNGEEEEDEEEEEEEDGEEEEANEDDSVNDCDLNCGDETTPIDPPSTSFEQVKKSLFYEEEFRSINQSEPIHIFLKLKPVEEAEMKKQNNQVNQTKL